MGHENPAPLRDALGRMAEEVPHLYVSLPPIVNFTRVRLGTRASTISLDIVEGEGSAAYEAATLGEFGHTQGDNL